MSDMIKRAAVAIEAEAEKCDISLVLHVAERLARAAIEAMHTSEFKVIRMHLSDGSFRYRPIKSEEDVPFGWDIVE